MSGTTPNSLWQWFDKRIGLEIVVNAAREKQVPLHRHTIWYYFGGMTLFLFSIQAVTGMLLLLYYRPSAENAFESVQFIVAQVRFGWLIRSIHSWSANLLVAVLFIHLFSVFFLRAYRRPRELTWITGVLLLFVTLAFGFSGYLLPWNTISFFATQVGTEVAGVVPGVGPFLVRFLRGGNEVSGATLTRFFAFHVAMLPALSAMIACIHLLLVQRHGMSVPFSAKPRPLKTMQFVPNFLLRDVGGPWFSDKAGCRIHGPLFVRLFFVACMAIHARESSSAVNIVLHLDHRSRKPTVRKIFVTLNTAIDRGQGRRLSDCKKKARAVRQRSWTYLRYPSTVMTRM